MRFVNKRVYHIYNRGIDGKPLFSDNFDYKYFLFHLQQFNDEVPASPLSSYYIRKKIKGENNVSQMPTPKKPLVDIIAFTLMPNHFHLLLAQKRNAGVSNFLRKIGTGYTHYFNRKYKRSGHLFEGKFRSQEVKKADLVQVTLALHADPLKFFRSGGSFKRKQTSRLVALLSAYQWSSLGAYLGETVFPLDIPKIIPILHSQLGAHRYKNYKKWLNEAIVKDFFPFMDTCEK